MTDLVTAAAFYLAAMVASAILAATVSARAAQAAMRWAIGRVIATVAM